MPLDSSMTRRDVWNRCDECGRFIPLQDFADGEASRELVTPDSLVTRETFETLCKLHSARALQRREGSGR